MQNPRITNIEKTYEERIIRVAGFSNLVNVVVYSLDEFEDFLKKRASTLQVYECKTASTVKFAILAYFPEFGETITTEDIPIQVPDSPKK